MTTIAFDGTHIAADTLISDNGCVYGYTSKIHQVKGTINIDISTEELLITDFSYDGKGSNVYLVLSKGGNFKDIKVISKELKRQYNNEELKIKVDNISKLLDKGYDTVSVYTKKI